MLTLEKAIHGIPVRKAIANRQPERLCVSLARNLVQLKGHKANPGDSRACKRRVSASTSSETAAGAVVEDINAATVAAGAFRQSPQP